MLSQLGKWLRSPDFDDEEKNSSAILLNIVTLTSSAIIIIYAAFSVATGHSIRYVLPLLGILVAVCVVSQVLLRRGHVRAASLVFLTSIWCVITLTIFLTGGVTAPAHVVYLTLVSISALLLGAAWGIFFTVISTLTGLIFAWLQVSNRLPLSLITYTPLQTMTVIALNALMILVIVLLSVRNLRLALRRTNQELAERRKVEQDLQASESRYRALVEQVPAIVYTAEFGRNGRWLFVSPQIESLLGFPAEEWTSDPELWYQQLHPEDSRRAIEEEARSRRSGEPLRSEYRLLSKTGREIWFLDEAAVIRNAAGRPLFLQGVMYNITERKLVEEKLARSENKYRQLADLLPQVVFEADVSGRITYANRTAFDVFGYTQDDFAHGLNSLQMIAPEDRPRAAENILRIINGEDPVGSEYTALSKSGKAMPVLIFSAAIREGGAVVGFRGIIVDISERKQAEEKLRESEERFRSTFENAPIGMALVGLDDRILQVNQALCQILGYAPEKLLGRTVSSITYPEDRESEVRRKDDLVEDNGESFTLEKRYIHANGSVVWGQLSVSLVKDRTDKPLYFLGQMQDISSRKQAEEVLRANEQKYQRLYKDAERQTQELMLLHRVRTAMSRELELGSVIQAVVEAVAETFGYTLVSLYLLDGDVLQLQSQIGYHGNVIRQIPVQNGICGRVVRTKKPILIPDVRSESEFLGAIENITSEVCVPLLDQGEVVGVLNVESIHNVRLTDADLLLMTALSEYVSLGIERARLYTGTRENEKRFRTLIENSTDIISVLDDEGRIIYSSPSVERVMGYTQGEYLGSYFFEKIHPEDLDWVKALLRQKVNAPGAGTQAEFRFRHRNGTWRWIELTVTNAVNDPNIHGLIANYRDITDSRNAEHLTHTRAAYQSVLAEIGQRALTDGDLSLLMTQAVDLVAETLNVEFCEILELMPGGQSFLLRAGIGWKPGSVGHAIVEGGLRSQAGQTLLARTPVIVDDLRSERRFAESGLLIEHEIRSGMSVVIEGRDHPFGVLGVHSMSHREFRQEDVYFLQAMANVMGAAIGRAQADAALRSSEERYMLVAAGANDGLWDWDIATNEIYYSPRWKEMLGFSEDEIGNRIEEWLQRVHPDDSERVRLSTSPHLNETASRFELEYRIQHKDGFYLWVLNRGIILRTQTGEAYRIAGSLTDITKRKEAEQQLQFDAFHDPLTGLSNRAYLMERLTHVIKYGERRRDYRFAVLFLDLDEFKIVNDRFGHPVGDRLLKAVARRLEATLRSIDTLTRLGGDEFVILLEDVDNLQEALLVAERVQEQLSKVFDLTEVKLSTAASIGIVWSEYRYERPDEVLRDADIAMYRAKMSGKAHYHVFSPDMREQAVRRMERELDLRHALERRQFKVFYQPIYSFETKRPIGIEALLRWKHPTQGLVMPGDFIKIAEDSNLIVPIDRFVLSQTCSLLSDWERSVPMLGTWTINVNLSSKHFMQPNLADSIQNILRETRFDPTRIVLEITESVIMENVEMAMNTTRQLHDLGIQIGLDDFGTGYSSLNYLTRFPVDILKLDQSFVPRIMMDDNTREIVDTVVKLAKRLGMKVVAEGIETEAQLVELQRFGCELGQGYLFSRPLDQDALESMISGLTGAS